MSLIYLDYNATTPIADEVADAMEPFLRGGHGNPSSPHARGRAARAAVDGARADVAALLGCRPEEVVFTGGGTESDNHAIRGALRSGRERGNHIITSAIEHPAVLEVCRDLEREGARLTVLPVDGDGLVRPDDLAAAFCDDTVLVTIMYANNEVGTLQPIPELARLAHDRGALFHTDAAQAIGKVPCLVDDLGVDLLTVAGHKLYAPKGVGALYVREGTPLTNLMFGAGHEGGRRPGTENVLGLVGLGAACRLVGHDLAAESARQRTLRDRLERLLLDGLGAGRVRVNGHPDRRLPNTLSVSFRGLRAADMLAAVTNDLAASAGAACHGAAVRLSAVLEAMGVTPEWGAGTIRLSLGRGTTADHIERAAQLLLKAAG